jgi:hypothetical protein
LARIDAESAHDTDTIEMELTAEQLLGLTRAAADAQADATSIEWTAVPVPAPAAPAPLVLVEPSRTGEPSRLVEPSRHIEPSRLVESSRHIEPSRGIVCVSPPVREVPPRAAPWNGRRVALLAAVVAVSIAASTVAYHLATKQPPPVQVTATHRVSTPIAREPVATPPAPEGTPVLFKNPFDATEVFEFPSGTSQAEARDAVAALLLERARERHAPSTEMKASSRKTADEDTTVAANKLAQRN